MVSEDHRDHTEIERKRKGEREEMRERERIGKYSM